MDLTDFKSRSDKKKVFDAMAAASIFNNSAGVDTSRAKIIPLDSFVHFLEHFQREGIGDIISVSSPISIAAPKIDRDELESEARALIEVSVH